MEIDVNDVYNGSDPFIVGKRTNKNEAMAAIEFNLDENDPIREGFMPRMQNQDRASAKTEEQTNANRDETNQGFFLTEAN